MLLTCAASQLVAMYAYAADMELHGADAQYSMKASANISYKKKNVACLNEYETLIVIRTRDPHQTVR